eukprot:TRINITY_DN834_c0_g1_i5.p1 TRINITY_DN834_c0_g1~~TRINITY_DN834_c0_g1_i5.p1  ORF type:complete len:168 (-),score=49.15 TRINITY_DN834_c0_g1_i5:152-655(-)
MAISLPDIPAMGAETYNNFMLASVQLPTGVQPVDQYTARLQQGKALMDSLKSSSVAPIATGLAQILLALGLDAPAVDTNVQLFSNHSFVFSSVPGYDQTVCVANKPVCRIDTFYPNMISQLILLTYCDKLSIALCTDPSELKQPELLVQSFIDYLTEWHAHVTTPAK